MRKPACMREKRSQSEGNAENVCPKCLRNRRKGILLRNERGRLQYLGKQCGLEGLQGLFRRVGKKRERWLVRSSEQNRWAVSGLPGEKAQLNELGSN